MIFLITLMKQFVNTGLIIQAFLCTKNKNMTQFFTTIRKYFTLTLLIITALAFQLGVNAQDDNTILGAGGTFVYPLFSKQFSEYNKKTGIQVNYQSIGSRRRNSPVN
jgi:ABC-type phosphate transport system substrate-binding protein